MMLLSVDQVSKSFGDVAANRDVSLAIEAGEIHALLGENGAGKSTLVKMIYGVLRPDQGSFSWMDEPVEMVSPAYARALGIGMVFQHFSLFDALSVAENIALALPAEPLRRLKQRILKVSQSYGLTIDPDRSMHTLSVGEKQRVEIIRCLLQEPKLLIMDEPTSVLTPQEADYLFDILRKLRDEGCSILYISHRLDEIRRLCSRATILRQGQVVATCDPREKTAKDLAELMVGSRFGDVVKETSKEVPDAAPRLILTGLTLLAKGSFETSLNQISLTVNGGEIVGIAGVAGEGQSELMEALTGERLAPSQDMVMLGDRPVGHLGPSQRRVLGAAFVTEERNGHGAVPTMSLSENGLLTHHGLSGGVVRAGVIDRSAALHLSNRIRQNCDVRAADGDPPAGSLSGGNLQKFVVGREMDRRPDVLIVSQPTWGVDAAAAALIRQALIELAQSGSAVLMFSQDLEEIFAISDRVAVLHRGELSQAAPVSEMTPERVGLLMGGAQIASQALETEVRV